MLDAFNEYRCFVFFKEVYVIFLLTNLFINPSKSLLFSVTGSVKLCNFDTVYELNRYFLAQKRIKFIPRSQTKTNKYDSNK